MKILLGATVALLLGALGMSWNGMQKGVASAPPEELARIKRQIEDQNLEILKLKAEKERSLQPIPQAPQPQFVPPADDNMDDLKAALAAKEAELAKIEGEKSKAERNAKVSDLENLELSKRDLEKGDPELRRARLISQALLAATVRQYEENKEVGDIIVLDIVNPELVQVGSILAVRKNTGLLGKVKVTGVETDGAIASPMASFGSTKPQPGDQLIVDPQL